MININLGSELSASYKVSLGTCCGVPSHMTWWAIPNAYADFLICRQYIAKIYCHCTTLTSVIDRILTSVFFPPHLHEITKFIYT